MSLWYNQRKTQQKIKNALLGKEYLVVFDTETTGLKPDKDRIIQLSAIKYKISRDETGRLQFEKIGEFDELINPYPIIITPEITAINHISQDMVDDKETEAEIIPRFKEFCGTNFCFCGQNVGFDTRMLEGALARLNIFWEYTSIDTLDMARSTLRLENNKLITIAEYFGVVPEEANFHNSFFDVEMTFQVCEKMINGILFDPIERGYQRPRIFNISEFAKGRTQRTYISTSIGSIWYDRKTHLWGAGTKANPLDIDTIDMEYIEREVKKICIQNGTTLEKVKETVYA